MRSDAPRVRSAAQFAADVVRPEIRAIAPTLEDKVDILQNAIDLAVSLGVAKPKVAILAAVEVVKMRVGEQHVPQPRQVQPGALRGLGGLRPAVEEQRLVQQRRLVQRQAPRRKCRRRMERRRFS